MEKAGLVVCDIKPGCYLCLQTEGTAGSDPSILQLSPAAGSRSDSDSSPCSCRDTEFVPSGCSFSLALPTALDLGGKGMRAQS